LFVAGIAVVVLLLALCVRVVFLQGLGSFYTSFGSGETYQTTALPALRGTIYDREGEVLAESVPRFDIVADDYLVNHPLGSSRPAADAAKLATILKQSSTLLGSELTKTGRGSGYVVIGRLVSRAVADQVTNAHLFGITVIPDVQRFYPGGQLLTPVLGLASEQQPGSDLEKGLTGIEYLYDSLLSGRSGSEVIPETPNGDKLPGVASHVAGAHQGDSIVLTIDEPLQWVVTRDLASEIKATHAASGDCIITDPRTGDILAIVDLVNHHGKVEQAASVNALTMVYQPGSVMKLATIAGALQTGLITPETEITVPYTIYRGGYPFQDAEFHPTERLSVAQILARSSNVGTIEIASMLGAQRLYHFLRLFGYGSYTGLGWPGAPSGLLANVDNWWGSSMGSIPIGTGEAVTPMQILDAYNAIADGGVFVEPRLIQAVVGANGTEHAVPVTGSHRILDAFTASEIVPLLEGVVADGTGTAAHIPGYMVAGKTGTAQIPGDGGYIPGAWMATFVGFLPAKNPQLSGIVVLNRPTPIYGGLVSAPVFSEIMRYALRHFDVPPQGRPRALNQ
jgi:cell division protein FtsI (penicillin-binding protein 3)